MEWEPKLKSIFESFEYLVEEVIGEKRIREKKMEVYKGNVKKWQVLDDDANSREEVEKMQSAVKAPSPEELEMWDEQAKIPMILPITNANVSQWRDPPRAIDSADFDFKMLEYDRERQKRFFNNRYEKNRQLTSSFKREELLEADIKDAIVY
jgi:hypothetical protein